MRITVSFVLRAAGADSFAPLEKAVVLKNGERAMHRDGGYYVFITPMREGEVISVNAPGYQPTELRWNGESSDAAYLMSTRVPPQEIMLMAAGKYPKGAEELSVVCPGGTLPLMAEGCTLRYGKHSAVVSGWNRASGVVILPPTVENIAQGQSLTLTAQFDQQEK